MSQEPTPSRPWPLLAAVFVALVAGLVTVGVAVHRVAGPDSPPGTPTLAPEAQASPTPTPGATATPAATASPAAVAFADCSAARFGPALAPLNPPPNPHVYGAVPPMTIDPARLYLVTMVTTRGTITLCLQPDLAPQTVNIFVTLVRNHFYDGLKVPRSEAGFVIQAGSPDNTQSGNPGFSFKDEPVRNRYLAGALAMANSGPNTNGSQFFICTADDSSRLQPLYNLFGKVATGLDVAQRIQVGDTMTSVTVAAQR